MFISCCQYCRCLQVDNSAWDTHLPGEIRHHHPPLSSSISVDDQARGAESQQHTCFLQPSFRLDQQGLQVARCTLGCVDSPAVARSLLTRTAGKGSGILAQYGDMGI
jgi:hypothetical protein